MMRLENQIALVTGGAEGLGKAIALRLKREGARVVITDLQAERGAATAEEGGLIFLEQDVCNEEGWEEVVRAIEQRCGKLTILVNNAGTLGSVETSNPENTALLMWRRIFSVNVEGVFLGCRAAIPAMRRAGGGAIVNISSVAAFLATPVATAYGASKAAVRQLTQSVAQYCVEQALNIRCNSVHPGNVLTPLWQRFAEEQARTRSIAVARVLSEGREEVPMGDFTTPEDVAAAVAFLVSEDARHVTGSSLIVDGGIVECNTYRAHGRNAERKDQGNQVL